MKYFIILALLSVISAIKISDEVKVTQFDDSFAETEEDTPCEKDIPITENQLKIELDYLSRRLDMKYYKRAKQIINGLKEKGKNPVAKVNTW